MPISLIRPIELLLALTTILSTVVEPTIAAANDQIVVLQGANIIDGNGGEPIESATVVIQGQRITNVGRTNEIEIPKGAQQLDYRGKFLMPGLISVHSHVGQVDGLENGSVNYNRANILRQLRQYEAYGVTTVVSLGLNGPLFYELRDSLHSGESPGTDLFGADRGLGVAGGAPPAQSLRVEADQIDRPETPEQARAAVQAAKQRGTDLIKFWLDDFQGSLPLKMQPEIYKAIIDESHSHNCRVAAHIFYLHDAKAVVEAGADILAHGVRDQPVDEELIRMMKAKSVWYVATLGVDEANYIYAKQPEWLNDAFFTHSLQPALRTQLESTAGRERTLASPNLAKWQRNLAMNQQNLKALHDAGVFIGFGADSGANPLRIPGFAEHRELQLMTDAGIPPLDAITIATKNSARLMDLDDRGVLAPGKLADFIILDVDPSQDISRTNRIHAVWHRGKQVSGSVEDFTP